MTLQEEEEDFFGRDYLDDYEAGAWAWFAGKPIDPSMSPTFIEGWWGMFDTDNAYREANAETEPLPKPGGASSAGNRAVTR